MISIKKQLMLSIFTIMCLSTFAMAIIIYVGLKHEMDELFDENMVQIAQAIAVHDFSTDKSFTLINKNTRQRLKGEQEFLIQIWDREQLSYSSLPALNLPYQGPGGVKTIVFNNQKWRYFGIAQNDWLIQVAQPIYVRHSVIRQSYFELLIPLLVQLPILIGAIWFFVGYGFRPLQSISSSIEQRTSIFLDKLPEDNVPMEVSSMVAALNNLLGRLDDALKTQRRFTADAAHELRTPLTAVMLQLDILRRAGTDGEKEEAINELYKGVDRSTRLVRQLLELARQEPDAAHTVSESCDLRAILEDSVRQHEALAQDKNIELKIIKSEGAKINGESDALSIMVGNLINNAVLYTQRGGKVHLSLSSLPDKIILSVADNGPGISEDERSRIFDRFYRIMGTNITGSGLGLSIVKAVADRHNADISVNVGLDRSGAAFTVVFGK